MSGQPSIHIGYKCSIPKVKQNLDMLAEVHALRYYAAESYIINGSGWNGASGEAM
jgi:hypothetical protein